MTLKRIITYAELSEKIVKQLNRVKGLLKQKKYSNCPYFFEEYNKKVFVRSNGDGVIVASLKLHVNEPTKTTQLIRTFDISDAKSTTEFPVFDELIKNGNSNPFSSYGLWYSSENNIVTDICEEYTDEDEHERSNNKFLSFKLVLNGADLEAGHTYRITYALSIPGLYPMINGRFDGTVEEHRRYGKFRTSVSTRRTHKKLTYSVYMEDGIVFSNKPQAFCKGLSTKGNPKPNKCMYRNNMFYEKFNFTLENPQEYDIIYMQWDLKNQLQNP